MYQLRTLLNFHHSRWLFSLLFSTISYYSQLFIISTSLQSTKLSQDIVNQSINQSMSPAGNAASP